MNRENGHFGYTTLVWLVAGDYVDEHGCAKGQSDMTIEFNNSAQGQNIIKPRAELPQTAITYADGYATRCGLISNAYKEGTQLD